MILKFSERKHKKGFFHFEGVNWIFQSVNKVHKTNSNNSNITTFLSMTSRGEKVKLNIDGYFSRKP